MAFNINNFRSELQYGGARTSLFEVILTNPIDGSADTKLPFMCKAASLPASSITPLEASYFGRAIKLPGNRTFDEWAITVINDEDFKIRNAMETWSNAINRYEGNIRGLPSSSPSLYKTTAEVRQFSQTGNLLRTYKFVGLWPIQITPIQLNWENESIQEFEVSLALDYFYVNDGGLTGNAGGR
jgi:hypothetical protein